MLNRKENSFIDIKVFIEGICFVVNSINNSHFLLHPERRTKLFMLLQVLHPLKVIFFIFIFYGKMSFLLVFSLHS